MPMTYDPQKHHRRSIRLKGHDYAGGGTYFVTICAHREAGNIFGNEAAKEILARIWEEIAQEAEGGEEGQPVRAGLVSAPAASSFPRRAHTRRSPTSLCPIISMR
jgi:hypothetical protein